VSDSRQFRLYVSLVADRVASKSVQTKDVARLRIAVVRLARELRVQNSGDGLTPAQFSALSTVNREGPLTLGQIAEIERISPPGVTKAVDKLASMDLVERKPHADDRRAINVVVTGKGRDLLANTAMRRSAWLHSRLTRMSQPELDAILTAIPVLERLVLDEVD
jgi:DNA-binding MarR family transcriptional regulator